ncbi:hypothetical protein PAJ34TS1_44740 [Paenibacillus azoreducens]|uniref:Uncharacterized protein n=1 Tax=Paenibacillus azoreducens TaxID=116718 RepID=A0A919YFL8_9BACL|nr:hypothetical protein J34TS1_50770 [Paenibacillus azoreducens]
MHSFVCKSNEMRAVMAHGLLKGRGVTAVCEFYRGAESLWRASFIEGQRRCGVRVFNETGYRYLQQKRHLKILTKLGIAIEANKCPYDCFYPQ